MDHALPRMDLDGPALAFDSLAETKRVVEEHLVFAHVHSNRRQPGQITIQRLRKRVARVVPAEVESRGGSERLLGQQRVRLSTRFHTHA